MTILQMEYFIAVAQTGSFRKAADRLYISQQGISKQIAAVEKELEMQLIDRTNRKKISLTKEGKLIFESWKEIIEQYRIGLDNALISAGKKKKVLRIGVYEAGPIADYVMPLINGFRTKEPDTEVECIFASEEEVMARLDSEELDLAFAICRRYRNYVVNCYPVYYDRVCIAISRRHPLAAHEKLYLKDVADIPLYVLKSSYSFDADHNIKDILKRNHMENQDVIFVKDINNLEMMLNMAEGFDMAPRILLRNTNNDIKFYPIEDPMNADSIILHVIWKDERFRKEAMRIIGAE